MRTGLKLCSILICGALAVVSTAAFASDASRRVVTTEMTYSADSVETQQIQRWLADHAVRKGNGQIIGAPSELGEVRIAITTAESMVQPMVIGAPPVPLPASGSPGDRISVTSSNSRFSETWQYRWEGSANGGGKWVLVSYHFDTLIR
ncbi:MAG: hypothetical protein ACREPV_09005 [Lysobacter sp.]